MAHSKSIQLLILALFLTLVLCKPVEVESDSESESESESEVAPVKKHVRESAMKAIRKYTRSSKIAAKQMPKTAKATKFSKPAPKPKVAQPQAPKVTYSDLVVQHALLALVDAVVEVPTTSNAQANVLLTDLYAALQTSSFPTVSVTTVDTKDTVIVPAHICTKVAMDTVTRIVTECEMQAQRDLMKIALAYPDDTKVGNELIKVMFTKLYGNRQHEELQKAFARIESKMKLPLGTIYRQYKEGVAVPRLPERKLTVEEDKKKVQNSAAVEDLYSTINSMDLTEEQEMTEAVRAMINANLKKIDREKEAEKDSKPTWTEFLFGK